MKILLSISCILTVLITIGCTTHQKIQKDLTNYLNTDNPNNVYSACTILGSIQLDENEIGEIQKIFNAPAKTKFSKICTAYILSKKINENSYNIQFINLFPVGHDSVELFKTHERLGYPITLSSPLVEHLFTLSNENDTALAKFASLSNYADGSQRESILTGLSEIYCYNPEKITNLDLISKSNLQFIKLTSKEICK